MPPAFTLIIEICSNIALLIKKARHGATRQKRLLRYIAK